MDEEKLEEYLMLGQFVFIFTTMTILLVMVFLGVF